MADTEMGTIVLRSTEPKMNVVGLIAKPFMPSAGYGGWTRIARPRRKALTEWIGRDSVSLTGDILFDNFREQEGIPVKEAMDDIERMAGIHIGDEEPPLLTVRSHPNALVPHNFHHASHVRWFIEQLSWNQDLCIWNKEGNPIRLYCTVVLTQYVEDDRLESLSPAKKNRAKKRTKGAGKSSKKQGASQKFYTVKRGDTLSGIAARELKSASRWTEIAKLNGIRDPNRINVGQKLKLP